MCRNIYYLLLITLEYMSFLFKLIEHPLLVLGRQYTDTFSLHAMSLLSATYLQVAAHR